MPRNGSANLKPFESAEEARERGRKGGINSGKARREKRELKEIMNVLLDMKLREGDAVNIDDAESIESLGGKNLTVSQRIALAMIDKAMKGSIMAAEYVRDTSGQRPEDIVNLQSDDDTELKININYGKKDDTSV